MTPHAIIRTGRILNYTRGETFGRILGLIGKKDSFVDSLIAYIQHIYATYGLLVSVVDIFSVLAKERCGESPVRGLIQQDVPGGLDKLLACYLAEKVRGWKGKSTRG